MEGFASSKKKNKQKLNWIRLAEHERIPHENVKYLNPRIKFDGLNWWITVGIECEDTKEQPSDEGVGIDLGIKDLAICSDKHEYKNINKTQKVKKLEKENAGYSVPYQEDMKKIRKEKNTVKQVTL